jgi:signal transduction histidine kinase
LKCIVISGIYHCVITQIYAFSKSLTIWDFLSLPCRLATVISFSTSNLKAILIEDNRKNSGARVPPEEKVLDQQSLMLGFVLLLRTPILYYLEGSILVCSTNTFLSVLFLFIPFAHKNWGMTVSQTIYFIGGLLTIASIYFIDGGYESMAPLCIILIIGSIVIIHKNKYGFFLGALLVVFIVFLSLELFGFYNFEPKININRFYNISHIIGSTIGMTLSVVAVRYNLNLERSRVFENNVFLKDLLEEKIGGKQAKYSSTVLRDAATMVSQTNQVREKLFNTVSHNIRGPITRIYGLMDLIQSDVLSEAEQEKINCGLKTDLDHILDLLDNLMLWSSLQKGDINLKPEKIRLRKIIDRVVRDFATILNERSIWINDQISDELYVLADRAMLGNIIKNLISNAIRFSYDSSEITIKAEIVLDMVRISVIDKGVGMTREQFQKVFDTNKVVGVGPKNVKGSGVGLLISKEYIHQMGGQMDVINTLGNGCTFSITIPLVSVELFQMKKT